MATLTKKPTVARSKAKTVSASSTRSRVKAATASIVETKIDHVFQDGTKFTGTLEQLQTVASALGLKLKLTGVSYVPKGYYPSESKGLTKISDMNEQHIRRALIKRSKDFFTEIYSKEDSNTQFLTKFTSLTEDSVIVDLYNELSKR
jgi:hypothetical protein